MLWQPTQILQEIVLPGLPEGKAIDRDALFKPSQASDFAAVGQHRHSTLYFRWAVADPIGHKITLNSSLLSGSCEHCCPGVLRRLALPANGTGIVESPETLNNALAEALRSSVAAIDDGNDTAKTTQKVRDTIADLRRRPVPAYAEEIDGKVKMMGEVRLDDERLGQMGFRTRPNHQIWPVVWPQREICSEGSGNCVLSEWI